MPGRTGALKDPAVRINRVKPVSEWVDLPSEFTPALVPYPAAWYRRDKRGSTVPKWIWDLWRQDPVTTQWSPADHAQVLELGENWFAYKPEHRLRIQTYLGLNARGRRDLRWRNPVETESAARADAYAREARHVRLVKPEET